MSNGALSNHWEKITIDETVVRGAVASGVTAVENAEGDVKGAKVQLTEEIITAQRRVEEREKTLEERKQAVADGLGELGLRGREIRIAGGMSMAAVTPEADSAPEPRVEYLGGVSGQIVDLEVGSVFGQPIEPASTLVISFDTEDRSGKGVTRYAIDAGRAQYDILAAPDPGEAPTGER